MIATAFKLSSSIQLMIITLQNKKNYQDNTSRFKNVVKLLQTKQKQNSQNKIPMRNENREDKQKAVMLSNKEGTFGTCLLCFKKLRHAYFCFNQRKNNYPRPFPR